MENKFNHFGKYILLEKLAMGGMAEVWLARAPGAGGIGKFVAVKKILPQFSENPEFLQMFKDEASIAMNLSHSNIVSIYEFGQEKNELFFVMDYVEGRNIRQILNKMKTSPLKFSTDQIIYIIKEVAAGLDHAHRSLNSSTGKPLNITHRDISPQNIMITFEGEVKIVDFGIAKAENQLENTRTGTLKGKFGYMSPEQAEGHSTDLRTDIFSLGIVLWELIAGDRLFVANNELNTLRKIRECNVPSLTKVNPNIHAELDRITLKSLTQDRNLRYQTAAAMHRDLNRFLNRQYPDFSTHDFSVFIKTLYTDEILELRARLVEYAKVTIQNSKNKNDSPDKTLVTAIPQQPDATRSSQQKTQATLTATVTSGDSALASASAERAHLDNAAAVNEPEEIAVVDQVQPTNEPPESLDLVVANQNLNGADNDALPTQANIPNILNDEFLKNSLEKKIIVAPQMPVQNTEIASSQDFQLDLTRTNPTERASRHDARAAQHSHRKNKSYRNSDSVVNLSIFVAFAIITYVVASTYFPKLPKTIELALKQFSSHEIKINVPTNEEHEIPQIQNPDLSPDKIPTPSYEKSIAGPTLAVVINSNPSGAEIFLNDLDTNKTTPSRIEVPTTEPFTLTLRLPHFIDYTKERLTTEITGRSFTATLQKAMVAYVDIDVKPPLNARVYVKGVQLNDEILPITKYAIPANTPVLIRAENPLTGISSEQIVTLREDQHSKIVFQLSNPRTPTGH
ncbi:MAG: protein kinase [Bdellovibrionales bacterium]